jgi:hypothetical protein
MSLKYEASWRDVPAARKCICRRESSVKYMSRRAMAVDARPEPRDPRTAHKPAPALALSCGKSVDFSGYWQRHITAAQTLND